MMKRAALLLVIMSLVYSVSAGQTVKESRDLDGFTTIGFGIAGNLYIEIGPQFSVVLEGDRDDLEDVVTDVIGDRLRIKQERWLFNFRGKVDVYITMPELEGLSVSGSGKAEVLDNLRTEGLDLSVSGSGNIITADLNVENLECSISGSGNIRFGGGSTEDAEVSISGSGNYYGDKVKTETMEVSVSGSGNCRCYVTGSLEARVSGSGHITYTGDPRIDARVSGSGRVRSAD